MRKVAAGATRRGQLRGQAVAHGVASDWLRLVSEGTLDDPVFVAAIRKAASDPRLWELVSPVAKNALVVPTAKSKSLGGTVDDVFALILDTLELLQHPANANFARRPLAALEHVSLRLDLTLQARAEADAERGRRNLTSTKIATEQKAKQADARALRWLAEVGAKKLTTSKTTVHRRIARREDTTAAAVKKAINYYLKNRPPKT